MIDPRSVLHDRAGWLREQIEELAAVPEMTDRVRVMKTWLKQTEEQLGSLGASSVAHAVSGLPTPEAQALPFRYAPEKQSAR